MRSLIIVACSFVALGVSSSWAAAPRPFVDFSPQGTVKGVRQVTARFAASMVPFADPRAVRSPFDIECSEKGSARWIDDRTWTYDFDRDLPAGVRCSFRVRNDLVTLENKSVPVTAFSFSTGGPAIESSSPTQGDDTVEEEQAFILMLNAEPAAASVAPNVYFEVKRLPQPVGVRIVEGADREAILSTLWEGHRSRPTVVLQAKQRLPNDTKVTLVWGKGVASQSGETNAQDQRLDFKTRKLFTANVRCERSKPRRGCIPLAPIRLSFSAPVSWSLARQVTLVMADGSRRAPQDPQDPDDPPDLVEALEFKPPFAESSNLRIELPKDLRDDAGRALANGDKFPQIVKTDSYPPLAKFSSRFGIIEAADAVLPVTVRSIEPQLLGSILPVGTEPTVTGNVGQIDAANVDQVWPWLSRLARARRDRSLFAGAPPGGSPRGGLRALKLPRPNPAKAFEVVGIPLGKPGLYLIELASPALGAVLLDKKQPMYVPAAALVTNLSVHFKWGAESSLVWVTQLDSGMPVSGAQIRIHDCKGTLLWQGQSAGDGIAKLASLPAREAVPNCSDEHGNDSGIDYAEYYGNPALSGLDSGLLVTASTGDDFAFVHSTWNEGIQPWRFNLPSAAGAGPLQAHTILDRSLLRAGETVHMKHVLRQRVLAGLGTVPESERPRRVSIRHLGSDQHYDLPIEWDGNGLAETTWRIPKEAKLGRYEITLGRDGEESWWNRLRTGEFRVQEFRVPLMHATVQMPAQPQVAAAEVEVDLSAAHLSGGAAAKLPVVVRAQIHEREFDAGDDYESYRFASGRVVAGIQPKSEGEQNAPPAVHQREELNLDDVGTLRTAIRAIPAADTIRDLLVEMEYRDPNGEVQTVSSSVPLWPAKLIAGISAEYWASTESISSKVAVLDVAKHPVAGASVVVNALQRKYYSHRKRLVGGFYGYDHVEEISELGELCRGQSAADGTLECRKPPLGRGQIILQATVTDDAGRTSTTNTEVFIRGSGDELFAVEDSDRIDVVPERRAYEPGENARFQVRMPFRSASALVTIEREGVGEAFVATLSGSDPIVEVPILPQYAPNVFVSVLAVRGRSADIQPTAMVDLGRPAFKLGVAEIRVGWKAHALKVEVKPERDTYNVREKAHVNLQVSSPVGSLPADAEVAVAAVDEGLLELAPNKSWDLLEAMMGRRGYGVSTATAQMQVVGKRHYGLKALPTGGGGGRQGTRELFDTLLLWNGRVRLDASGAASVDIPLNDSLTAFRIVAVATAGSDRFGTGAATIRSTQDLGIVSALPSIVREGDQLRAECSVRNMTQRAMNVQVRAGADGLGAELAEQTIELEAGAAKTVGWDITIPANLETLRYDIEANEAGGAGDHLRVSQRVLPAVPVRTLQATIYRWEEGSPANSTPIEPPREALAGRGGLRVDAAASISGGLSGSTDWMRAYPYTCLEQRVSRAVALRDEGLWREVVAALPSYVDGDGLLKYFPRMTEGSDVLTAYVLSIAQAAELTLPEEIRDKMEKGLRGFAAGSIGRRGNMAAADLVLRKLAAIAALARAGKAEPALLGSITVAPNLWPTSALLDWWEILARVPTAPQRDERLLEAERIVRARLTVHGTTMEFSTPRGDQSRGVESRGDEMSWLMVDSDSNAARLLLHVEHFGLWGDDTARLVRGLLGRQERGHWHSTVANAWARVAIDEFAKTYEATQVSGALSVRLAAAGETKSWPEPPRTLSFQFPWVEGRQALAVQHQGSGNPWITIQSTAAIPLAAPLWSGYQISKTMAPIEQRAPGKLSRGDLVRVHLDIDAQSDMAWVVVDDPLAAGCSHVGTGSARDSKIAQQGEKQDEWLAPVFEERPQDAYRAYYDFLPKGRSIAEYTLRVNHAGTFQLPPTRVEAMYAPEVFGELPNAPVEVEP